MSGVDRWEMLCTTAQPRRSGWAEWGDARPAALPARSPPRPVDAGGRGEGSGRVRGRGEEGTSYGGGGAERAGAAVAPGRTGDAPGRNAAAVAGGLVNRGMKRVADRVEDGRRSMDAPTTDLLEMLLHEAQRPWRSRWTQRDSRTDALPPRCPPCPPVAADGGGQGKSTVRRRGEEGTTHGGSGGGKAEREGAMVASVCTADAVAVAGGSVTYGAERVAGPAVARVERGNGGGGGGGELGTKRGLEERAALLPPPKRRAVSAKRQFPPGCGRDAAIPLGRGRDVRVDRSDVTTAAPLAGSADGLLLKTVPPRSVLGLGVVEEVASADGGSSMMNVQHHDVAVDAVLMKSSHDSDENRMACKIGSLENGAEGVASGKGAHSGELLGRKVQIAHLLPKWRMVPATRRFPPGCGRDAVAPLALREEGKVGSNLEVMPVDVGRGVLQEVVAIDCGNKSVNQCAKSIVGALNVGVLDGTVQCQELEEGELADEDVESQKVAGCAALDGSAGGRRESAVPVTSAVTEIFTSCTRDEMMQIKASQEGGSDAAQETENDFSTAGKCEMILLDTSAKCSFYGPSNEIVQGKRVLGSNGIKGDVLNLAMEDPGSSTLRSKVTSRMEKSSVLTLGNLVVNTSGSEVDGCIGATSIAQVDQELDNGEMATGECHAVQEAPVATSVIPHESTTGRHEGAVSANIAAELSIRHFSNVKSCGNTSQHEGRIYASAAAEDFKVMNTCKGALPKAAAEPWAEGPSKEHFKGKKEYENDRMKKSSMNVATEVFGNVTIRRSKVLLTARKTVKPPVRAIHKPPLDTLHRPFSKGKEESLATNSASFGPRKRFKVKCAAQSKNIPVKIASTSGLVSKENFMDEKASNLDDDDILKALAVHDGRLELYLNVPSCIQCHRQHGNQNADDRSKIRMLCRRFQFICRSLVQAVEQGSLKVRRVDLEADKIIRKLPGFTKPGPTVGNVRGVEVGDEFLYRVELAIVGLHRPYQGGIDTTDHNGVLVAISIVASGGYPDELSSSGELIYTGSGGKPAGKKKDEDQKLERGNLALKNCIKTKTPVRVIHGFKGQNREDDSHSRARQISTFNYDGLYLVVDCWTEGLKGLRVFKYRLQKIPGQPKLPLHIAKGLRKSVSRPGLCIADISQGKEMVPICVINDVDNVHPVSFQYISRIKYPSWLTKRRPQHHGCNCTDGCIDSSKCACAVRNGGKIPFNFNGAVVHDKPIIFECGPSCSCDSSCHNRVSQKGMKIPLEVFRTANTGWGVRSLRSISSGSFICEYVGTVLTGKEANKRTNDEYLFNISHDYDDEDHREGQPSTISGLNSSGPCSQTMEDVGFTIDASECGNIGRFINHSCSPNLYAQNVLWDHDDQRVPHIMFFAAENIPPLRELTYDYNYKIGEVHDLNGRMKVKDCHCGSPQCCGRLYQVMAD